MAWYCKLLEVIVKAFKKCCIASAVDGTDDSGMTVNIMGMLEVSVRRKMKALALKVETLTLIGKGR